jgi:Zn-dependent peptidase ImmA (M78 family)
MRQMVLAHEIGHDIFHRNLASNGLKEFELFDMKNTTEYEANIFGSHLLIDNDEVLALARDGYDIVQISSMLNSHINLLLIKMQEMNKMGYDFNVPYRPEGDFLKKIKV